MVTTGGPPLDGLTSLAIQARRDLAGAATLGPSLVAALKGYDAARTLPAAFRESMRDLSELLGDGVRVLEFLEQFDFLTDLIANLAAPLAAQAAAIAGVVTDCDALVRSGEAMDAAIRQVIDRAPSAGDFTAALDYMDAVVREAASLSSAMARAHDLDARLNHAHQAALDDLRSDLDASARRAMAAAGEVETRARAALKVGRRVLATLGAYTAALAKLSGDADVVSSQALPKLGTGVHLLGILASILDPLSGLLQKLHCVGGGDPAKMGAATTIDAFRATAAATIDGKDALLRELFGVVLSGALHTDRMRADILAVDALVRADQAAFDASCRQLAEALADLSGAATRTRRFSANDAAGNSIPVDNLLVDAPLAGKARAVFGAVQQAAANAGLIPRPTPPTTGGGAHASSPNDGGPR